MSAQPEMDKQSEIDQVLSRLVADTSADETLKQRLLKQPLSVLKDYGIPVGDEAQELSNEELARVTGGVKYDSNYVSSEVVDARGGQFSIYGISFTLDVNGKISSVSGK